MKSHQLPRPLLLPLGASLLLFSFAGCQHVTAPLPAAATPNSITVRDGAGKTITEEDGTYTGLTLTPDGKAYTCLVTFQIPAETNFTLTLQGGAPFTTAQQIYPVARYTADNPQAAAYYETAIAHYRRLQPTLLDNNTVLQETIILTIPVPPISLPPAGISAPPAGSFFFAPPPSSVLLQISDVSLNTSLSGLALNSNPSPVVLLAETLPPGWSRQAIKQNAPASTLNARPQHPHDTSFPSSHRITGAFSLVTLSPQAVITSHFDNDIQGSWRVRSHISGEIYTIDHSVPTGVPALVPANPLQTGDIAQSFGQAFTADSSGRPDQNYLFGIVCCGLDDEPTPYTNTVKFTQLTGTPTHPLRGTYISAKVIYTSAVPISVYCSQDGTIAAVVSAGLTEDTAQVAVYDLLASYAGGPSPAEPTATQTFPYGRGQTFAIKSIDLHSQTDIQIHYSISGQPQPAASVGLTLAP